MDVCHSVAMVCSNYQSDSSLIGVANKIKMTASSSSVKKNDDLSDINSSPGAGPSSSVAIEVLSELKTKSPSISLRSPVKEVSDKCPVSLSTVQHNGVGNAVARLKSAGVTVTKISLPRSECAKKSSSFQEAIFPNVCYNSPESSESSSDDCTDGEGRLVIREEPTDSDAVDVEVGCEVSWTDESGSDDEQPGDISYICRRCGETFTTKSTDGEYYFCSACKPPSLFNTPSDKHYSKCTCTECGIEFYSVIGQWTKCMSCSTKKTTTDVGTETEPDFHSNSSMLNGVVPLIRESKTVLSEPPRGFTYAKYECRVCSCDFYAVIGEWYYCSKCVSNSSSTGGRRKKLDKVLGFSSASGRYILYQCRMCHKNFYSTLVECYYCFSCSIMHSVRKRKSKTVTESENILSQETDQQVPGAIASSYARYTCKVCKKNFYSSIGQWDYCSDCNPETQLLDPVPVKAPNQPEINFFIRKNVIFKKYMCSTCSKPYFSSHETEQHCKNCRQLISLMKQEQKMTLLRQHQGPGDVSMNNQFRPIRPKPEIKKEMRDRGEKKPNDKESEGESEEEPSNQWASIVYEKYICSVCQKPFYSKAGDYKFCSDCNPDMKVPLKSKVPFKCAHCSFQTNLKKLLRKHLLQIPRNTKKACRCSQCVNTAVILKEGELQEVTHFERLYKCKKCDYASPYKKRYKCHKETHKFVPPLFSCKFCSHKTPVPLKLKKHVKSMHADQKVFVCSRCDYMTKQHGRLKNHFAVAHKGHKPYKCSECDECFSTMAILNSHISSDHTQFVGFKCKQCSYITKIQEHLFSHVSSMHVQKERMHCNDCDFVTTSKNILERHIKTTHKSGLEKCNICGYTTKQRTRLENHMLTNHKSFDEFKCDKCGFKTDRAIILKRHFAYAHCNDGSSTINIKSRIQYHPGGKNTLVCNYCGYKTVQPTRMAKHQTSVHKDEDNPARKSANEQIDKNPKESVFNNSCPSKPDCDNLKISKKRNVSKRISGNAMAAIESNKTVSSGASKLRSSRVKETYLYECSECLFKSNTRKIIRDHIIYSH